jgi:Mg-chelatase subunit ChlD
MAARLSTALQTALAFSLALQRMNVRTRVVRFPGMETVTEVLQRFGESPRSCSDRVKGLEANGGTPIGAACASELPLLLQQNRLKRFMVVITDDEPGDADLLHQVQARAAQSEVLVLGIGIGCDIRDHIPRSVGINNVSELPAALAELFRMDMLQELTA